MMGCRRVRRQERAQTLLPLGAPNQHSHSLSCWYCDFKVSIFNEVLFSLGRKHARFLRVWFTIGVAFSFMALIGVTMIVLRESVMALYLYNGKVSLRNISAGQLFGFSPLVPGLSISLMDAGHMIFSTLLSVSVHEFGHAVAAASEGMHIEYIAIYLAILFPGALVAFNYELLQCLPRFAVLRIYCAGIWHNAACCAVCGLTLFVLPLFLYPLYIHGENPVVLSVSLDSPLSGYLTRGDCIVSFDGLHIHNPQEWMEKMALMDEQSVQKFDHWEDSRSLWTNSSRKGYCVPGTWIEESKKIQPADGQVSCPDELSAFMSMPRLIPSLLDDDKSENSHLIRSEGRHCLIAKDIVKLKKCGDGWPSTGASKSSCACSEDESCLTPVQMLGLIWVEIEYLSPCSSECLQLRKKSLTGFGNPSSILKNCGGTFVFIGDVLSMAHSVQLTAYRPRWAFNLGAGLPNMLEKVLLCTFHVSATLVLLNSLPVFFLDGESILEASLCYITWLSSRKRRQVRLVCLLGGSLLSILAFSNFFLAIFLGDQ